MANMDSYDMQVEAEKLDRQRSRAENLRYIFPKKEKENVKDKNASKRKSD